MSTHNIIKPTDLAVCAHVRGGGGAGAVRRGSIDNFYLSTGLSWSPGWPWRGWSWFRCELGSWDELWSIFQLIAVNV